MARTIGLLLCLLASGCGPTNLLKGGPLADGVTASEGDDWLASSALELRDGAWPAWDLGSARDFAALTIQADHNDSYILELSDDAQTWTPVFVANPVEEPGLRTRSGNFEGRGRFVRLRAEGGDGHFSVCELQLFGSKTDAAIAALGNPLPQAPLAAEWTWLLVATALALSVVHVESPKQWTQLVGVALGLAAAWVLRATWVLPAIETALLDWIRAVVAAAALLAILRTFAFRRIKPAPTVLVTGVLVVTAATALLSFLNVARPQFHDSGRQEQTFLHFYDMRVYFPIARYFPELGFDGVYAASAAAVIEDHGLTPALAALPMTNLRTRERPTIGESQDYIREVRARFTPERWALFVADMSYFREGMGEFGFLNSMQDQGGNATPVWFLGARALFRDAPASDFSLGLGVAADVLLMVLAFVAIGWAFGPRTALLAMVVFGATDIYMFGSNWFGSTLRHDWMALWAIGLALLKKERFFLGGGLLAWAALIRVFPVISFVTVSAPILWALTRALRRGFSWQAFVHDHRPYFRFALGAATVGLTAIALSVFVFGVDAWPLWVTKITAMAGGRGINTVGLTNFSTERWVVTPIIVVAVGLMMIGLRTAPLHEAAAFGPALVAVMFSPMNYYLHCLFLLVMVGSNQRRFPWLVLLTMCAASYVASRAVGVEVHFDREAVIILAASGALILWQLLPRRAVLAGPVP